MPPPLGLYKGGDPTEHVTEVCVSHSLNFYLTGQVRLLETKDSFQDSLNTGPLALSRLRPRSIETVAMISDQLFPFPFIDPGACICWVSRVTAGFGVLWQCPAPIPNVSSQFPSFHLPALIYWLWLGHMAILDPVTGKGKCSVLCDLFWSSLRWRGICLVVIIIDRVSYLPCWRQAHWVHWDVCMSELWAHCLQLLQ